MTPRDLLIAYDHAFRAKFGYPAPISGSKDAKLAKGLIERGYELADLSRWLTAFMESPDEFIRGTTYGFGVFCSCLGKLIASEVQARQAAAKAATDDAAYRAMRERVIAEQDARARAMEGR